MDRKTKELITNLESSIDKVRMQALQAILDLTDQKVDWVYEIWDDLFKKLTHVNSFQRSIAVQVICNLAKSDTENRLDTALDHLLAHTKDEKFITSRQYLKSIWKVAVTGKNSRKKILAHPDKRFVECVDEKHSNLLRLDMIQSLRFIYDATKDANLLAKIQRLIATEQDEKYRRKYAAVLNEV